MRNHAADAKVIKAFCDINRLQVLELLRGGEKCACVLLEKLQIGQSTLSHHMKILCDSGIVVALLKVLTALGDGVKEAGCEARTGAK